MPNDSWASGRLKELMEFEYTCTQKYLEASVKSEDIREQINRTVTIMQVALNKANEEKEVKFEHYRNARVAIEHFQKEHPELSEPK